MSLPDLSSVFQRHFGAGGEVRSYFSPGRVNLIGEHVDYCGGPVFPCALSLGTWALARKREDRRVRLASTNFPVVGEIDLDALSNDPAKDWMNYPAGVLDELQKFGGKLGGFDVLFHGTLPNGAGLSSSASIELATAVIADDLFSLGVDRVKLVQLSQRAENVFVGVNCGIMDQFAIGMGKKDHAVFLNCGTLDFRHVPLALGSVKILIANTNKRRGLADSKYNERRGETEQALASLRKSKPSLAQLADASPADVDAAKKDFPNEVVHRRARHVATETARTKKAVEVLAQGDLAAFGRLMNESHHSLRDDYEVTGKELDSLAGAIRDQEGVLGARMTGAGFGGCTVSLVEAAHLDAVTRLAGERYRAETGLQADFYVADVGDGTGRVK